MRRLRIGDSAHIGEVAPAGDLMVGISASGPGVALQAGCLGLGEGWRLQGAHYAVGPMRGAFPEGGVRLVPSHTGELQLVVDLRAVPAELHHLVFVAHAAPTAPGGPTYAAAGRMRLSSGGADTAYMDLDAAHIAPGTALLLAELKRHGGDWWLGTLGRPYPGGIVQLSSDLGIPVRQLPFPTPMLDNTNPAAGAAAYLQAYRARTAAQQQPSQQQLPFPSQPPAPPPFPAPFAPGAAVPAVNPPAPPLPSVSHQAAAPAPQLPVRHDGHGNAAFELAVPMGLFAVMAEFTPGGRAGRGFLYACDAFGRTAGTAYSTYAGLPGRGLFTAPADGRCRLRVEHEGPWSVALLPLDAARSIGPVVQGQGSDVVRWEPPAGLLNVQFDGNGPITVALHNGAGRWLEDLVDENNRCTLRLPMRDPTRYLHIRTDGRWTLARG
ncbi:TerD family protein [Yinghuangia sp. YIM S09857]|uniref:TerD family protein n=1 Tax=Yinghuangia sp. YIM S09857 TaxID=3436929 RepID=UPI003F533DAF